MAINPPTDIIADVISAADPSRVASVEARLKSIASAPSTETFAQMVDQKGSVGTGRPSAIGLLSRMPQRTMPASADPAVRSKQAAVEFEGAILGILFNEIMPKDQSMLRGQAGAGGDVWHSVLSGEIGRAVAKSGVLKLQERLFRTHPAALAIHGAAARATQMSDKALSQPVGVGQSTTSLGASRGRHV